MLWFDIIITVFYMRASSERPTDRPSTADEYTYSYAVGLSFALSHRHFIALSLSPSCLLFLWQTFFSGTSSKYICPVRCVHFRTLELYGLFGCFFISHLFFPLSFSLYLIRSILQVFSWLLRSMFNFISTVVCGVRSLQQ